MPFTFLFFTGWAAYLAAAVYTASSFLLSFLMRPGKSPGVELGDMTIQSSNYGERIREVWGTVEIAPQVISTRRFYHLGQITQLKPCWREDDNYRGWTARFTGGLSLGKGEIKDILRIKINGEVVYNVRSDATEEELASSALFRQKYIKGIYKGTETQTVDPILLANHDVIYQRSQGNVESVYSTGANAGHYTAHRGLAYTVFQELPLEHYGNRLPQFLVEVCKTGESADETQEVIELSISAEDTEIGLWSARKQMGLISYAGRLWMVGGADAGGKLDEVWSSETGEVWRQEPSLWDWKENPAGTILDAKERVNPPLVVSQNLLCIGGEGETYSTTLRQIGQLSTQYGYPYGDLACPIGGYLHSNLARFADCGVISLRQYDDPNDDVDYSKDPGWLYPVFICGGYAIPRPPGIAEYRKSIYRIKFVNQQRTALIPETMGVHTRYKEVSFPGTWSWELLRADCGFGFRSKHKLVTDLSYTTVLSVGGTTYSDNVGSNPTVTQEVWTMDTLTGEFTRISTDLTDGAGGTVIAAVYWNRDFYAFVSGDGSGSLIAYKSSDGTGAWTEVDFEISDVAITDYDAGAPPAICVHNGVLYFVGGARSSTLIQKVHRCVPRLTGTVTAQLDDTVTEICGWGGLSPSDIDLGDLSGDVVRGYVISSVESIRDSLQNLLAKFYVDVVEVDGKLLFRKRGNGDSITVDEDDLGVTAIGGSFVNKLEQVKNDWMGYPYTLEVSYLSQEGDYSPMVQSSYDVTTDSKETVRINLPLVLTDDEAKAVAMVFRDDMYLSENEVTITLPPKYITAVPTDVITTEVDGITYTLRINKKEVNYGDDVYHVKFVCVLEDVSLYSKTYTGIPSTNTTTPTARTIIPILEAFLDIPILDKTHDDLGFYIAAAPGLPGSDVTRWEGTNIYKKIINTDAWSFVGSITEPSMMGVTLTQLGSVGNVNFMDKTNTVDVLMKHGVPATITDKELYYGKNMFLCGDEIIQAKTVTHIDGYRYRFSNLLRARVGTLDYVQTHGTIEKFIELDISKLLRVKMDITEIRQAIAYRIVTLGNQSYETEFRMFTNQIIGKKPLPPGQFNGVKKSDGSWKFTWLRSPRGQVTVQAGVEDDVVLVNERYVVDFYSDDWSELLHTVYLTFNKQSVSSTLEGRYAFMVLTVPGSLVMDMGSTRFEYGQNQVYGGEVNSINVVVSEQNEFFERGFGVAKTFVS